MASHEIPYVRPHRICAPIFRAQRVIAGVDAGRDVIVINGALAGVVGAFEVIAPKPTTIFADEDERFQRPSVYAA